MKQVKIKHFSVGTEQPLLLIAGPCVIESEEHCLRMAEFLKRKIADLPIHFIFKASYDKANRSSIQSYRGPGMEEGLRILEHVSKELDLPILTDVHTPSEAAAAAEVCDVIQIPAFLCRQTDLLVAAGKTGCVVNIKKGQFLAPWDMSQVVEKTSSTGNRNILLTDRGTMFGYNNLVSDMRAIPIMQGLGCPVLFDASHSVQLPGKGGQREFIPTLAKAAVAAGCNGLYIESHHNPVEAKSDAEAVMDMYELIPLLHELGRLHEALHKQPVSCG